MLFPTHLLSFQENQTWTDIRPCSNSEGSERYGVDDEIMDEFDPADEANPQSEI